MSVAVANAPGIQQHIPLVARNADTTGSTTADRVGNTKIDDGVDHAEIFYDAADKCPQQQSPKPAAISTNMKVANEFRPDLAVAMTTNRVDVSAGCSPSHDEGTVDHAHVGALEAPQGTGLSGSFAQSVQQDAGNRQDLYSVVLAAVEQELQKEERPSTWKRCWNFMTCLQVDQQEKYCLTDENVARGNWSGKYESTLSNLAYIIGVSNITHFPYICYKNGGVAFTVPYVLMLILLGVPLFYMEASLGQFCSRGILNSFNLCPLLSGIGFAMMATSVVTAIYYGIVIAWGLYYFYASFYPDLPWANCNNDWNTYRCNLKTMNCNETDLYVKTDEGLCVTRDTGFIKGIWNKTAALSAGVESELAAGQYLRYHVLRRIGLEDVLRRPDNTSAVHWDIALCSLLVWFSCIFFQAKGIKSSGKIVYFTISVFAFLLITLLVHGLTLDGNRDGVAAFLTPDWSTLKTTAAWSDSASLVFFSLSISYGGLSTLCSYNRFKSPLLWNVVTVVAGAMLVNLCSSMIIYCLFGFLADSISLQLSDIVDSGMDVAFVLVPTAFSYLPYGGFWAALFYGMFIITGIDSQTLIVETITTGLSDKFVAVRENKLRCTIGVCFGLYLLGLPLCTGAGYEMVGVLSKGTTNWAILMIAFCELVTILWVYGYQRFAKDIALMTGQRLSVYWTICWHLTAPVLLVVLTLLMWAEEHNWDTYPPWVWAITFLLPLAIIIWIPVVCVYHISRAWKPGCTITKILVEQLKPRRHWGPALSKHRVLITYLPHHPEIRDTVQDSVAKKGPTTDVQFTGQQPPANNECLPVAPQSAGTGLADQTCITEAYHFDTTRSARQAAGQEIMSAIERVPEDKALAEARETHVNPPLDKPVQNPVAVEPDQHGDGSGRLRKPDATTGQLPNATLAQPWPSPALGAAHLSQANTSPSSEVHAAHPKQVHPSTSCRGEAVQPKQAPVITDPAFDHRHASASGAPASPISKQEPLSNADRAAPRSQSSLPHEPAIMDTKAVDQVVVSDGSHTVACTTSAKTIPINAGNLPPSIRHGKTVEGTPITEGQTKVERRPSAYSTEVAADTVHAQVGSDVGHSILIVIESPSMPPCTQSTMDLSLSAAVEACKLESQVQVRDEHESAGLTLAGDVPSVAHAAALGTHAAVSSSPSAKEQNSHEPTQAAEIPALPVTKTNDGTQAASPLPRLSNLQSVSQDLISSYKNITCLPETSVWPSDQHPNASVNQTLASTPLTEANDLAAAGSSQTNRQPLGGDVAGELLHSNPDQKAAHRFATSLPDSPELQTDTLPSVPAAPEPPAQLLKDGDVMHASLSSAGPQATADGPTISTGSSVYKSMPELRNSKDDGIAVSTPKASRDPVPDSKGRQPDVAKAAAGFDMNRS